MRVRLIVVAAAIAVMTCGAWAANVSLTTVADTDLRSDATDYAKGNRETHYIGNSSSKVMKGYFKFELPADFGTATDASFEVTFAALANASWYLEYQLFGLKDSVAGNDWQDLSPGTYYGAPDGGLTWNNAPANNTADDYSVYTDDFTSDATAQLGSFQRSGGVGSTGSISTQALVDFLNTDTDGVVTLMLSRFNTKTGSTSQFYSKENTDAGAVPPTLDLTYTPVPEPATVAILGIGGLIAAYRRKND